MTETEAFRIEHNRRNDLTLLKAKISELRQNMRRSFGTPVTEKWLRWVSLDIFVSFLTIFRLSQREEVRDDPKLKTDMVRIEAQMADFVRRYLTHCNAQLGCFTDDGTSMQLLLGHNFIKQLQVPYELPDALGKHLMLLKLEG